MESAVHYLKRTAIALVTIWIGLAIYTLLSGISELLTSHHHSFSFWPRFRGLSTYAWQWIFMTPLALWFADRFPIRPADWVHGVVTHLVLFLLLTLAHGYTQAMVYVSIGNISPDMQGYAPWQHTGHILFLDDFFLFDALIYIFLVASQNISNFYSLVQQKELDAVRMQGQLTEARLQTLLMQVNPHFLFNTLNSIAVLVRKHDTEGANAMIEKLSAFFRHTLDTRAGQWVPLQQELDMVEQYLDIEQVRIGPRLNITINIDDAAQNFPVPMLITQPLVENAIRHGVSRKPGNCELHIDATVRAGLLTLKIGDTGAGCDFGMPESGGGIGLNNVRERLRHSYGDKAELRLEGIVGHGAIVTLELPDVRGVRDADA
ncbi:MAG: histidine kinase [Pseudomonadota bacterium]|nr:histidine kinase [Pseudomonadota bacterium]